MVSRCTAPTQWLTGITLFVPAVALAQAWDPSEHQGEPIAPAVCFMEGTPDHYVQAIHAALERKYGPKFEEYQLGNRWTGGQGSNIVLTWSLVPDGLSIPSGVGEATANSSLFARMNTLHANNTALWISKFQAVFDRWEALCGIDFQRVTAAGVEWDDGVGWGTGGNDTTHGDIRISMKPIDGVNGILGYTAFPNNGDMVLDSQENWGQGQPNSLFFRNTVAHELGHALGLGHVCPVNTSKLLEPFLATNFDGPRHDDVRAVQRHYGDDSEDDNAFSSAFDVGALTGTTVSLGAVPAPVIASTSILSMDANGEQDWYKFTINQAANLSVTLTPVGTTYLNGAQLGSGACSAGTSFNSLAVANLGFEVRNGATGATILTTVNNAASGLAETLTNFNLAAAGTYYVRVFESDSPTESQLYNISFDADPACTGSVAAGGAGCAGSGGCTPAIALTGCPSSNQNITFAVSNAVGPTTAVLSLGLTSASIVAPNGCILRVGSPLPFTVTLPVFGAGNCNGALSVPTTLPVFASAATLHMQAICGDAGVSGGFTLSNSIAVTFGP